MEFLFLENARCKFEIRLPKENEEQKSLEKSQIYEIRSKLSKRSVQS